MTFKNKPLSLKTSLLLVILVKIAFVFSIKEGFWGEKQTQGVDMSLPTQKMDQHFGLVKKPDEKASNKK